MCKHGSSVISNNLFIFGGLVNDVFCLNHRGASNKMYCFNTSSNTWSKIKKYNSE